VPFEVGNFDIHCLCPLLPGVKSSSPSCLDVAVEQMLLVATAVAAGTSGY
jgi:hypothetical protein